MNDEAKLPLTPSQTVGPYFTLGLTPTGHETGFDPLVTNEIRGEGEPITIHGRVFDGGGASL